MYCFVPRSPLLQTLRCFRGGIVMLMLSLLVGCQSNEAPNNNNGMIAFASTELTDTRGMAISNADQRSLISMGIFGYLTETANFDEINSTPNYMYNQLVQRIFDGSHPSDWEYTPTRYWPNESQKLTFVAYAPHNSQTTAIQISKDASSAYPKIHFAVPDEVKKQVDFLIADPKKDVTRSISTVPLHMKHALTRITFTASLDPLTTPENYKGEVKLLEVRLKGIRSTGTTVMTTPVVWSELNTPKDYLLSIENGLLNNVNLTSTKQLMNAPEGDLLLMPQLFDDLSNAVIEVVYGRTDATAVPLMQSYLLREYTNETPWMPGYSINYNLLFSTNEITIKAELKKWIVLNPFNGGDDNFGIIPWD